MNQGRILLTGGTGKLGTELQKHLDCYAPKRDELDITAWDLRNEPALRNKNYDLVIHCAGYTDVIGAQKDPNLSFKVNYVATKDLVQHFRDTPFVFISSEYAKHPELNQYSRDKYFSEMEIELGSRSHLIIRTLFKPRPWPFDKAFGDQYTQGDYVDVIAKLIADKIKNWYGKCETVYIGTGRKTMYDLAIQTKPDVIKNSVNDITEVKLQKDYQ